MLINFILRGNRHWPYWSAKPHSKSNMSLACLYPILYGLLLVLFTANQGFAQTEASSNSATQLTPLIQAPTTTTSNTDNRVFAPSKIFQRSGNANVTLDLKERPVAKIGSPQPFAAPATRNIGMSLDSDNLKQEKTPQFAFEFADWVQSSIGMELPIFGSELMSIRQKNQTEYLQDFIFQTPIDPLTVPADYRVGPGDEIIVQAWGQIDIDFQGPIDRSGTVFLPKIGKVVVAGQKLADLKSLFHTAIAKQYKSFELTVTLGSLRQIQFYVSGFAKNPGIHTAPSTVTSLHGILVSGGALPAGDLRRIELRRAGKTISVIDAYQLLAKGNRSNDPQLLPGDVLYIPAAVGYGAIAGSVRRSAIFHLTPQSTVAELLELAGGLSIAQDQAVIHLESQKEGKRQVEKFILNAQTQNRLLKDGDILMVLPPSAQFDKVVTIRGNVAQPLRQNWQAGMKVSDLIKGPDSLIRFSIWMKQNSRTSLASLADPSRDVEFRRDFPEVNWDYAVIERLNPQTLSQQLISFNLAKALAKDPREDQILQSGDSVVIFSLSDFRQPQSKKLRLVRVEGEVNAPGVYSVAAGQSLQQAIEQAGGLTSQAYLFGMMFHRDSAKKEEALRIRELADRIEQDYLRTLAGRTKNAMTQEEGVIGNGELEVVKTLVSRLRDLKPEGRVALNLSSGQAKLAELPEIEVEDSDTLVIPAKPSTVSVIGAVYRQGSLIWRPGMNVQTYIDNSGGYRQHADKSGVVVFRADGVVRQQNSWLGQDALNPGDTIMVPEDVTSVSWSRTFRDWSQIFYQLGLGGAALKVLRSSL